MEHQTRQVQPETLGAAPAWQIYSTIDEEGVLIKKSLS
jgi:hypothetical protein